MEEQKVEITLRQLEEAFKRYCTNQYSEEWEFKAMAKDLGFSSTLDSKETRQN